MTDVNATLQLFDTGTSTARPFETDDLKTARTGNATQTTLAAVLAKLSADPATQTTLAAVLAKLSSDPATQTTLAAVLAKLSSDPATGAKQDTQATKLDTLIAKDYATQTTLAAVLAKIIAAPATEAKQDSLATAVGLLAKLTDIQPVSAASLPLPTGAAQEHATAASPHSARLTDGTTYLGSTGQRLHVSDGGVALGQDLQKVGGTAVDTNSGNKSGGTQRVVLATDQPALSTPLPVDSSVADGVLTGNGRKTVTTAGTAVVLAGSTAAKWVILTALATNTDKVSIGISTTLSASGSQAGVILAPGEKVVIPVSNLNTVYVDSRVNGEGVAYAYGA